MFKKVHVFRVKPKQELLSSIAQYCRQHGISSGVVIGIVGTVESARLEFLLELPGKCESADYSGPLEIICAQGSVASKDGSQIVHIHIQLAGQNICQGGHLAEATVFSTAEVVVGELDYQLLRQFDSGTGRNELVD